MYADETGNLDYDSRDSPYFGFGTAVFPEDHGQALFDGLKLRTALARRGLQLPRGFHAKNDTTATRDAMFALIKEQGPRFDTTFLHKPSAYAPVRDRGQMYLYQMAWFLHFKSVAVQVANSGDDLVVIAGTFGTKKRSAQAQQALNDVCDQINRTIHVCTWEASTSWGLQVADYGLWATHRHLVGGSSGWYDQAIRRHIRSRFLPWGPEREQS